jgi:hypothetical protein
VAKPAEETSQNNSQKPLRNQKVAHIFATDWFREMIFNK